MISAYPAIFPFSIPQTPFWDLQCFAPSIPHIWEYYMGNGKITCSFLILRKSAEGNGRTCSKNEIFETPYTWPNETLDFLAPWLCRNTSTLEIKQLNQKKAKNWKRKKKAKGHLLKHEMEGRNKSISLWIEPFSLCFHFLSFLSC